jgi:DNA replication and repair protein RecF
MHLLTLQARNFRNFERLELEFGPRLNILVGHNGQGKTNLLESIYVLGQLRSFRGVGRAELTRWGADVVSLQGTLEHPARDSPHRRLPGAFERAGVCGGFGAGD